MSEPNRKAFLEQIRRLAGLDFFPKEEVAIRELFHALWDAAKSIDHAKRILDRWLASETKAPTPSEIRVLASQVPIVAEPPPPGCDDCRPTGGWRSFERNGYSASEYCVCPLGQYRRKLDRGGQ